MRTVNRDMLHHKIVHSRELTALEKRYIEKLVKRDQENGHFIESDPVAGFDVWACSVCGEEVAGVVDTISFCPYCGVRMDGGVA